ncbi:MAG: ABC transporter ATP-binding protein [Planctomycetota bacterium]|nr:MAG: ABC transporter ATP-binding protein [Planctomycetota bacterium]
MMAIGFEYRRGCVEMIVMHLALVTLTLSGLGLTGLGIDYIRSVIEPGSASPHWPFQLAPPADWSPMRVVVTIAAAVMLSGLLTAVIRYFAALAAAKLTQRILLRLRSDVYAKLQQLNFDFYDSGESSSIINRAAGDVNSVRSFVDGVIIKVLTVLLTLVVYLSYMLRVHVPLTIVCLSTTPLLWWGASRFSQIVQPAYRRASELGDAMVRTLVENLQGIHVVKGFAREPEEIERFRQANDAIQHEKESIFRLLSTWQPTMGFLTQINMLILIGYGGWLVIHGQMALGSGLFVFANLLHEFANQVGQITAVANTIQASLVGSQRVFEVLDTPVKIVSPPDAVQIPRARGEIVLDHVTFGYRLDNPVLKDLTLTIRPGECLAVTGETGSGKSTLLALLMRFYDVQQGAIKIDAHDVRRWDVDSLRRNIGLVFQEAFLFSHTVAANVAFGRPDATQEEIERAARIACADRFIQEMPEKYDTVVGEHGANLSGGQRQRLSIARALLLDPPILLFDDATASVDPETEHEIREALESAMQGRTTIVVSNRLSTLRRADRILVLENGRLSALGQHAGLMQSNAYYRRLAELQFGV